MSAELLRVIVVDDSELLRQELVELLAAIPGIKIVGEASSGTEALARIDALRPDLVILDIAMPNGNGIDVLRKVKRAYPDIKVIMLTNYAEYQYRTKCEELHADHFLSKATDIEALVTISQRLAANKASPATGN